MGKLQDRRTGLREYRDGDGFERFWEAWPRHERKRAKAKCKAFWKTHRLEPQTDDIIRVVESEKQTRQWQEGFIPMPYTWLNQRRFEDNLDDTREESPTTVTYEQEPPMVQLMKRAFKAREGLDKRKLLNCAYLILKADGISSWPEEGVYFVATKDQVKRVLAMYHRRFGDAVEEG